MASIKGGGGTAELEDHRKLSKSSTFRILRLVSSPFGFTITIIRPGDIEVLLYYRQLCEFFLDIKAK